jgi:hypothetical protein
MRRQEFLEVIARFVPGLEKEFASFFGLAGFLPSHACKAEFYHRAVRIEFHTDFGSHLGWH